MKKIYYILVILITLFVAATTVEAKNTYYIDNPHIVEKHHKVTIEWQQTAPVYVVVYKLTSNKRQLPNNCNDIETFGQSCKILWQATKLVGTIHVTDRDYRNGDAYYIRQNVYLTHNGGYGPFYPKYR